MAKPKAPKSDAPKPPAGPTLFDWVNALCVTGVAPALVTDKSYNQFMLNRALAQNIDTLLLASRMNAAQGISNEDHFAFLVGTVVKKRRYGKWAKNEDSDDTETIETISKFYDCRDDVARQYARVLSPEQVAAITARLSTGGQTKSK